MVDKFTPYERKLLEEIAKLEAELNDTIAVYGEQLRREKEENQRLRDALSEIVDTHIESHEDAYVMRDIAKQALETNDE